MLLRLSLLELWQRLLLMLLLLLHLGRCCIANSKLESFRTSVLGVSTQRVTTRKFVAAEVAFVVACFEMNLGLRQHPSNCPS